MAAHRAPGLTADWLNAWLAAIGVAVLLPDVKLSWSCDPRPAAIFHSDHDDLASAVYAALPSPEDLDRLATARHIEGAADYGQKISLEVFLSRAGIERAQGTTTLAACVTDLARLSQEGTLASSPFNLGAQGDNPLLRRVERCLEAVNGPEQVAGTFGGSANRVEMSGLGFDIRRFMSRAENPGKFVDPVVESLVFAALSLFPIRGDGRRPATRGWKAGAHKRGAFSWGAWSAPLDRWAIDAWLDQFHAGKARDVRCQYDSVPYLAAGQSDANRGYASEARPS